MGNIIAEFLGIFVVEMLIEGTGYAILRVFLPKVMPTEDKAMLAGLAFWLILALLTALLIWGILIA